jgi:hypothetical protein
LLGGRNVENGAGTQAIHVPAIERIRIGVEESDEHLLERHVGRLDLAGDARQRVAAAHVVGVTARATCRRTGRCAA